MDPDIFITDFERTDNTDELHAILGRALIIATRFDSMCKAAANLIELKKSPLPCESLDDTQYSELVQKISGKYTNLSESIIAIDLPKDIGVVLHDARLARNEIAHDVAKGLTGCLDTTIDETQLVNHIAGLVMDITYGDTAISCALSAINDSPCPNIEFMSTYNDRVVQWVVSRYA